MFRPQSEVRQSWHSAGPDWRWQSLESSASEPGFDNGDNTTSAKMQPEHMSQLRDIHASSKVSRAVGCGAHGTCMSRLSWFGRLVKAGSAQTSRWVIRECTWARSSTLVQMLVRDRRRGHLTCAHRVPRVDQRRFDVRGAWMLYAPVVLDPLCKGRRAPSRAIAAIGTLSFGRRDQAAQSVEQDRVA